MIVTGCVIRFVKNLKKVFNTGEGTNGELLLEEAENAKLLWVKYEQPFIINHAFSSTKNMCKCCILLFTCCVTREVHLELTFVVNSTRVILALRRFIAW